MKTNCFPATIQGWTASSTEQCGITLGTIIGTGTIKTSKHTDSTSFRAPHIVLPKLGLAYAFFAISTSYHPSELAALTLFEVVESITTIDITFSANTVGEAVYATNSAVGGSAFPILRVHLHITLASAFTASLG